MTDAIKPGCKARRVNDEYQCANCGLTWPADDPDPPECSRMARGNAALGQARETLRRNSRLRYR